MDALMNALAVVVATSNLSSLTLIESNPDYSDEAILRLFIGNFAHFIAKGPAHP